jgi:ribonuclease HII
MPPSENFQQPTIHDKSEGMPDLHWETLSGYPKITVAGVDEVGRGCLAGPVVAAALILPPVIDHVKDPWVLKIADSKKLTHEMREILAPLIEKWALKFAIGVATVEEIDRINIHHASHLAMMRALEEVGAERILIDGKFLPKELAHTAKAVVKGDDKCLSIAAASILAKVWRDRHMAVLSARYPGYQFENHKGYSTPVHQAALKKLGPCEIHRRSFAPVAELLKSETEPEFLF